MIDRNRVCEFPLSATRPWPARPERSGFTIRFLLRRTGGLFGRDAFHMPGGQKSLRLQGRHAAQPSGRDGLAIHVISHITGRENARHRCCGREGGGFDEAVGFLFDRTGKHSLAGVCPMAIKMPSARISVTESVFTFRIAAPTTLRGLSLPRTSSSTLFQITWILGFRNKRSCRMRSARNASRRWTTVTVLAKLVRNSASSTAVLPPPMTITSLPL